MGRSLDQPILQYLLDIFTHVPQEKVSDEMIYDNTRKHILELFTASEFIIDAQILATLIPVLFNIRASKYIKAQIINIIMSDMEQPSIRAMAKDYLNRNPSINMTTINLFFLVADEYENPTFSEFTVSHPNFNAFLQKHKNEIHPNILTRLFYSCAKANNIKAMPIINNIIKIPDVPMLLESKLSLKPKDLEMIEALIVDPETAQLGLKKVIDCNLNDKFIDALKSLTVLAHRDEKTLRNDDKEVLAGLFKIFIKISMASYQKDDFNYIKADLLADAFDINHLGELLSSLLHVPVPLILKTKAMCLLGLLIKKENILILENLFRSATYFLQKLLGPSNLDPNETYIKMIMGADESDAELVVDFLNEILTLSSDREVRRWVAEVMLLHLETGGLNVLNNVLKRLSCVPEILEEVYKKISFDNKVYLRYEDQLSKNIFINTELEIDLFIDLVTKANIIGLTNLVAESHQFMKYLIRNSSINLLKIFSVLDFERQIFPLLDDNFLQRVLSSEFGDRGFQLFNINSRTIARYLFNNYVMLNEFVAENDDQIYSAIICEWLVHISNYYEFDISKENEDNLGTKRIFKIPKISSAAFYHLYTKNLLRLFYDRREFQHLLIPDDQIELREEYRNINLLESYSKYLKARIIVNGTVEGSIEKLIEFIVPKDYDKDSNDSSTGIPLNNAAIPASHSLVRIIVDLIEYYEIAYNKALPSNITYRLGSGYTRKDNDLFCTNFINGDEFHKIKAFNNLDLDHIDFQSDRIESLIFNEIRSILIQKKLRTVNGIRLFEICLSLSLVLPNTDNIVRFISQLISHQSVKNCLTPEINELINKLNIKNLSNNSKVLIKEEGDLTIEDTERLAFYSFIKKYDYDLTRELTSRLDKSGTIGEFLNRNLN